MDSIGELLKAIGPIGIFAYLIIVKILEVMNKRREERLHDHNPVLPNKSRSVHDQKTDDIHTMIKDLYSWHNKESSDGVKVWYHRESLERVIKSLSDAINKQTNAMENLAHDQKRIIEILDRLRDRQ